MKKIRLMSTLCGAAFTLATSLGHAVILDFESRLGGLAYYDPNLNITWAANATGGIAADKWDNQVAWAADLSIGGVSGWRLPSADVNGDGTVVDCSGGGVTGCEDNELGFLYWEEGITPATPGPFSNVELNVWWYGTEFDSSRAWDFFITNTTGTQAIVDKNNNRLAWAVYSGDVVEVPVPAAVWLFASGLLGLIGIARRR